MNRLQKLPRLTLLCSLLLVGLSAPLGAAEKAPQGLHLRIGTILASNESEDFDPKLSRMKNQLEVIKYSSYRLIKEEVQKVQWRLNAVFEVPGGRSLVILPQEYRNQRLALKVRLLQGDKPLVDTTVRLRNRGYFLLGGPAHEGGVLILSIFAMTP
ncbi:MAG: hypothetical protein A3I10_05130 [Deltaproteobacteria bacterium RIFCSPLOWO2_02_FULL_57_26]|nr:MAG: hypothetical protein A3I10_05130 [Deltaproteobacteria bacterium RIFCSPLOWO2_02_FULL_57_26]OGQ74502.1 MAG: hypothetical protein A3G40_12325 [Deltaproteobacteria bacterium RIFCSPLOWO2_12_FULL_57_22]